MTELSYHRDNCRLCGSTAVECVVPLRPIPVATPNIDLSAVASGEDALRRHTVPLDLYLCLDCGHFQLLDIVNPQVQYTHFQYKTSISLGLPEHFRVMAREVAERVGLPANGFVLEIGSNDGTLLRAFQELGAQVLGVDPACKTAEAATASGVETLATFFTAALGREIRQSHGGASVVVCNNTFANIDEIGDLMVGVCEALASDGVFVFETSYGADVVRKTLIDTVYHEHLSYFLVRPLERFFQRHGLELYDIDHIWTKGGSIRGYVQRCGGTRRRSAALDQMIADEMANGFDKADTFKAMAWRLNGLRADLESAITHHVGAGRTLAGYGASVGAVTLLQQFDLARRVTAIFDDNPLADALIGPDYRIPILPSDQIRDVDPAAIIILAWRYADPIQARHKGYLERGGAFIVPLPSVAVHGGEPR